MPGVEHGGGIAGEHETRRYEAERVAWLWHYTSLEDEYIIVRNSEGVNSRFFEPGPYQPEFEEVCIDFMAWYLENMTDENTIPA